MVNSLGCENSHQTFSTLFSGQMMTNGEATIWTKTLKIEWNSLNQSCCVGVTYCRSGQDTTRNGVWMSSDLQLLNTLWPNLSLIHSWSANLKLSLSDSYHLPIASMNSTQTNHIKTTSHHEKSHIINPIKPDVFWFHWFVCGHKKPPCPLQKCKGPPFRLHLGTEAKTQPFWIWTFVCGVYFHG